jgi:hypothetical protein
MCGDMPSEVTSIRLCRERIETMKAHAQSQSFNDRTMKSIISANEIAYFRVKESLPVDKHELLDAMCETLVEFAKVVDDDIVAKRNANANIKWSNINV